MSRINLKELIEELEKISLIGDYHYEAITDAESKVCKFYKKVEVPLDTLDKAIQELKQLENIYNQ
jgi:hypothetical protein